MCFFELTSHQPSYQDMSLRLLDTVSKGTSASFLVDLNKTMSVLLIFRKNLFEFTKFDRLLKS